MVIISRRLPRAYKQYVNWAIPQIGNTYNTVATNPHTLATPFFLSKPLLNNKSHIHTHNTPFSSENHKASFGYQNINSDKKAGMVHEVFTSVADKYDFMNDLMSLGVQRIWKNIFVNQIDIPLDYCMGEQEKTNRFEILDLAGGTGDISFRILQNAKEKLPMGSPSIALPKITVCDINEHMLRVGVKRAQELGHKELNWVCADGEQLPFEDNTFDFVTIAFGIRNFTDIPKGLKEMLRVLKPGGRLLCLEFSKVDNSLILPFYNMWNFYIIPYLGQLFAQDKNSYQYLVESIEKFPSSQDFAKVIWDVGFRKVSYSSLTGGIVNIHSAYKDIN